MEASQPWERQAGEGDKAWAAFVAFRDLGPRRTVVAALRSEGKNPGSLRRWEKWASQFHWRERARAWDAEVDRRSREAQVQAREDMARRHIEQAMALQALGRGQLGRWLDPTNPEKPTLNIWSVMQLIAMGTNLERLARGTPEEEQDTKRDLTWSELMRLAEEP